MSFTLSSQHIWHELNTPEYFRFFLKQQYLEELIISFNETKISKVNIKEKSFITPPHSLKAANRPYRKWFLYKNIS